MVAPRNQGQFLLVDRVTDEVIHPMVANQANVSVTSKYELGDAFRRLRANKYSDRRPRFAESGDQLGEDICAYGRGSADDHFTSASTFQVAHNRDAEACRLQQLLGVRKIGSTCWCQDHTALLAIEKRSTEVLLQADDSRAQCRLAEVNGFACLTHRSLPCDLHEGFDLRQEHRMFPKDHLRAKDSPLRFGLIDGSRSKCRCAASGCYLVLSSMLHFGVSCG